MKMVKTNRKLCKECKYGGFDDKGCNYLLYTKQRRNCPPGYCDKYEKVVSASEKRKISKKMLY